MTVVACSNAPAVVTGYVQFNPVDFVAAYPQFTGLTNAQMSQAFYGATRLLKNCCGSAVQDANEREYLLYLLTAHLCLLQFGTNDGAGNTTPPQNAVGRVSNATEGSVNASLEYNANVTQSEAFYIQTQYGALYWESTNAYRMALYIGAPCSGPNGPGFPFGWDGGF